VTRETARVFARYWLFQIPGQVAAVAVLLLLVRFGRIGDGLAWALFGFWVLKDLVMFPWLRIAYESGGRPHGADALVGSEGRAQEALAPGETGWVRVGPELWRARLAPGAAPIAAGAPVRVVSVRDLTLRVESVAP
jgi:membrane protein implicated in regulation of membrane protease activity